MRNLAIMRSPPASAADGFIELDGARLRYRDEGSGFPLLLIHGWALDLDMWEPQAALAGRLRVIRFDRRGFGASSGQPSLDADARDVESLLLRLNVARAAVLGMSQGARVALRVAAGALRSRIACLILDGAPFGTGGGEEPEIPLERYRQLARTRGLDAFRAEWKRHPFARLHTQDPAARELLDRITARYPAKDLQRAGTPEDAGLPDVGTIDVPALVLNGALDTTRRRAMGDELCRALRSAERALVPAAGHLPNLDDPAAYNRLVLGFVERHADTHPAT